VAARSDAITGTPKLMFGTKWPSITSRCNMSISCSILSTSSPSRAKSAASSDGAMRAGFIGRVYPAHPLILVMNMPSVLVR